MLPVIGMTMDCSPGTDIRPFSKGDDVYYENFTYVRYIEKTQCVPVLLPTLQKLDKVPEIVAALDGIILTGGDDVLSEFYGEKTLNPAWRTDGPRTHFEAELIKEGLRRDKPIYGICRGCQMLNVALGGKLFQDIPTQTDSTIGHSSPNKPHWETHEVTISPNSLLYSIVGKQKIVVTTSHHQAIKEPVDSLRIAATAADGIIEAVEMPDKDFVLGVQWHPEVFEDDPLQLRILERFIQACM